MRTDDSATARHEHEAKRNADGIVGFVRGRKLDATHGQKRASRMNFEEFSEVNCPWEEA